MELVNRRSLVLSKITSSFTELLRAVESGVRSNFAGVGDPVYQLQSPTYVNCILSHSWTLLSVDPASADLIHRGRQGDTWSTNVNPLFKKAKIRVPTFPQPNHAVSKPIYLFIAVKDPLPGHGVLQCIPGQALEKKGTSRLLGCGSFNAKISSADLKLVWFGQAEVVRCFFRSSIHRRFWNWAYTGRYQGPTVLYGLDFLRLYTTTIRFEILHFRGAKSLMLRRVE